MRVLIIGADGMIGHAVWRYFHEVSNHHAVASTRTDRHRAAFGDVAPDKLIRTGDLENGDAVAALFESANPDMVINCAGITKHADAGLDAIKVISANCLLPRRLAVVAGAANARMVHVSTDCVFLGDRGNYSETDVPDATDLYGRSKVLGEITDQQHVLTIRTSTVGFELDSHRGLLEWFISQSNECRGFSNAIFSGVTSMALARILDAHVLPRPELSGLLHIAGPRIDKFTLLCLFRDHFGKSITINCDEDFKIDRSLDGSRFAALTGFAAPDWDTMLSELAAIGR